MAARKKRRSKKLKITVTVKWGRRKVEVVLEQSSYVRSHTVSLRGYLDTTGVSLRASSDTGARRWRAYLCGPDYQHSELISSVECESAQAAVSDLRKQIQIYRKQEKRSLAGNLKALEDWKKDVLK
jgi:hypothetical protein